MPRNYNLHLTGTVGYWNFSKDQVSYILDNNKEKVNVLINSLGGSTYDAMAISALFRIHGNVYVHYMGVNASAATIASMGAKHVSMDIDALYLVHKCSSLVLEWDYFNADELDAKIQELKKQKDDMTVLDCTVAGMYARRCKKSQSELLDLMKEDRWLSAQEALDWGFIDEITSYEDDDKPDFPESVVSAMTSAGIPLPKSAIKKSSALSKLINALSSMFSQSHHQESADEYIEAGTEETQPQSIITMTEFKNLLSVLSVAIAFTDGVAFLSEEQINAIESRMSDDASTISQLNDYISEKDAKINELNKRIAELAQTPATPDSSVVESAVTVDSERPSDDVASNVASLLAQLS